MNRDVPLIHVALQFGPEKLRGRSRSRSISTIAAAYLVASYRSHLRPRIQADFREHGNQKDLSALTLDIAQMAARYAANCASISPAIITPLDAKQSDWIQAV